jgi:hypothetical protein
MCYCHTCKRSFHDLGINSHRAAHRRKRQDCEITYTNGDRYKFQFSQQQQQPVSPTNFHSLIIKGVIDTKTDEEGWRIVGIWGDEDKKEGNRIGPRFPEDQLGECEALVEELEREFTFPAPIADIVSYLSNLQNNA